MVAGQGTKDHGLARRMAYADPARFGAIIDAITDLTVEYLAGQVEAGVDAVQLFDSWAGSLSPAQFKQWVITPTRSIVDQLRVRRSEEHTSELLSLMRISYAVFCLTTKIIDILKFFILLKTNSF